MNKEELLKEFNDKVEGVKQELLAKLKKRNLLKLRYLMI